MRPPGGVDFIALDVETASSRMRHSICQIGMVAFRGGAEVWAGSTYVDPRCAFDLSGLHGIGADHVRGAPVYRDLHEDLAAGLAGQLVVAHSTFDRGALAAAGEAQGCSSLGVDWVDSVELARAAWPGLPNHRLPTLAAELGHTLEHHDALADARACAIVTNAALQRLGHDLRVWLAEKRAAAQASRADARWGQRVVREGSGEGVLLGQVAVLTGDFSVSKSELADQIAAAGGAVAASVTKKTTLLVTGGRDASLWNGKTKSGKLLKAEQLMATGVTIDICTERELWAVLRGAEG